MVKRVMNLDRGSKTERERERERERLWERSVSVTVYCVLNSLCSVSSQLWPELTSRPARQDAGCQVRLGGQVFLRSDIAWRGRGIIEGCRRPRRTLSAEREHRVGRQLCPVDMPSRRVRTVTSRPVKSYSAYTRYLGMLHPARSSTSIFGFFLVVNFLF